VGKLTTHVLDTAIGKPASALLIELWRFSNATTASNSDDVAAQLIKTVTTNLDGRVDGPLLEGAAMIAGLYELRFRVGDYHRDTGARQTDPPFLDVVPVRFAIADADSHYHVPLLVSPYGYSTYRGS